MQICEATLIYIYMGVLDHTLMSANLPRLVSIIWFPVYYYLWQLFAPKLALTPPVTWATGTFVP